MTLTDAATLVAPLVAAVFVGVAWLLVRRDPAIRDQCADLRRLLDGSWYER